MEGATTRDILQRALLVGALPETLRPAAEKLVERMGRPVRVTLLGLPGSGKSSVLNLLAGAEVIPDGVTLPTLQLIKGPARRATMTLPDGETEVLDGATAAAMAKRRPVFVQLEMDLPALGKISILEVVTGVNRSQQSRAAMWAARRSDLAIWCTRAFTRNEQATWSGLPDALKDHGVLLRTAADEFGDPYEWSAQMVPFEEAGGDQFRAVIPIATQEALAARRTGGAVDKARFRASGAPALISTVLKVVELGRQATIDQADIILHKHGIDASVFDMPVPDASGKPAIEDDAATDEVAEDDKAADDDPKVDAEEPEDDEDEADQEAAIVIPDPEPQPDPEPAWSETAVASIMARLSGDSSGRQTNVPVTAAVAPAIVPVPAPAPAASNVVDDIWGSDAPARTRGGSGGASQDIDRMTAEALTTAVDRLARVGVELLGADDVTPTAVMRRAVDELQWLSDHLESTEADDDAIEAARAAAMDATDLVQLMQIEKRDSAATEAISLMIQIRRGFRQTLAAA